MTGNRKTKGRDKRTQSRMPKRRKQKRKEVIAAASEDVIVIRGY